ncbi:pyridoxamine 5'-phosphate oxidase family protein [uncultured Ruminococcus sp.]|uniref:pyridoxamine 5'-phosphate oxidase family protein n=1 Tax=uncultured Ruminococcus sp. TaxID=165186 RepID=UPI0025EF21B4|nr:pyridoxamine 5'-phosphate oxidase family protein [uncultured Ruminococcus sp.]
MNDNERLWQDIGTHGVMVLSTCADNRVTSRSMTVVVIDGRFYCQTNKDYLKCRQIAENPNAALCFGNYSIEGRCSIIGKPYDNPEFISAMEKFYPDAVKRWSGLPEECVLEITPTLIKSWVYENNVPYIETWDFSDDTYRKEKQ